MAVENLELHRHKTFQKGVQKTSYAFIEIHSHGRS